MTRKQANKQRNKRKYFVNLPNKLTSKISDTHTHRDTHKREN